MALGQWYYRTLEGRGNIWAETGRLARPLEGGMDQCRQEGIRWGGNSAGKSPIPEGRDWENVGQGQVTASLKCQTEEWMTRIRGNLLPSFLGVWRNPLLENKQWIWWTTSRWWSKEAPYFGTASIAGDRSPCQIGLGVKGLARYRKSSVRNKVGGLRQDHSRSSIQPVGSRSLSAPLLVPLSLLQASLVAFLAQPEPFPLRTICGRSSSLSAKMAPLLESSLLAPIDSFAPHRLIELLLGLLNYYELLLNLLNYSL